MSGCHEPLNKIELEIRKYHHCWISFDEALPEPDEMVEAISHVVRPQYTPVIVIMSDYSKAKSEMGLISWRTIEKSKEKEHERNN